MGPLDELLVEVLDQGGSDLHITAGLPPVMRRHGRLCQMRGEVLTAESCRTLVHGVLRPDQRVELEKHLERDFGYSVPGRGRFRVNVYYQRGSLAAAFRVIPDEIKSFEQLGLPLVLQDLALKPRGLVLVTGATGSGKSTTLASMVDHVNKHRTVHIITIEDPIEHLHRHGKAMITQREVGSDTDSFASALRYALRQDPDVLLIGEMRDLETIDTALTAAETGHLVLATLHTVDAVQTVDRVIGSFPPEHQPQVRIQLAGTLQGIISQQLLPTIEGSGRVVATEVLVPTPAVRNMIREGKTHQLLTVMQTGHQHGMSTMDDSLADLYRRRLISLDTALKQAGDPANLRAILGKT